VNWVWSVIGYELKGMLYYNKRCVLWAVGRLMEGVVLTGDWGRMRQGVDG